MTSSWALLVLVVSVVLSTTRADCDELEKYLSVPSPMTTDMKINLDDVTSITCEQNETSFLRYELEEVYVSGGTLTIKSSNSVSFINMGFTVASGATLVFDMPETVFGPNTDGSSEGAHLSAAVEVEEGGSAMFLGKVVAKEVSNVSSLFSNAGLMEFKKKALFQDGGSVFYEHSGVLKFLAEAEFLNNRYIAVENIGSGSIRFSKEVVFDDSASDFDGASGCSVTNEDFTSEITFDGPAIFKNNDCFEGAAVYNSGVMTFNDKAYFNDNENNMNGGAVRNVLGTIVFNTPVYFNNNYSSDYGGGIAVEGGSVTFKNSVTFDGNSADSGAAFAVQYGQVRRSDVLYSGYGSLTFEKSKGLTFKNNEVHDTDDQEDDNCLIGEVADEAVVEGFPFDNICDSATS